MALPLTIGASFLATSSQGRTRPYISASTGYVFIVLQDDSNAFIFGIYRSTDPDSQSFFSVAGVVITGSSTLHGIATFQDGDNIHIATQDENDVILYHLFDMDSESMTTQNEVVTSAEGTSIDADKAISISLETDGSIIIFYQGLAGSDMGAKQRVTYARKPAGGSWTVDLAVDDGGAVNYYLGGIVRGEADKFHLVYHDSTNSNAEHKSTQDVDGALSSVESTNDDNLPGGHFRVTSPVYYDDGGVERITCAWKRLLGGDPFASEIDDDGVPGAQEQISSINVDSTGNLVHLSLSVDQKTVVALYRRDVDDDIQYASNTASAGWSSSEELDAITCNLITSNVYQRGDDIVLAYVYDDAGTIKYNEKVLRTVGGGSTDFETLAATSVGVVSLSLLSTFIKTLVATGNSLALLSRIATSHKALVAAVTGISLLNKGMFKDISSTSIGVSSLNAAQFVFKALAVTVSAISSLGPAKILLKALAAVAVATASLTRVVTFLKNLAVIASTVPSLVRGRFAALVATSVGLAAVSKKMFLEISPTAIGIATLNAKRFILKALAVTAAGVVSLLTTLTASITLSTVSTAIAGIRKGMFVGLSATAIATANFVKGMFQALSATSVGAVTITATQLILKTLAATVSAVVSLGNIITFVKALAVVAVATASLTRIFTFLKNLAVIASTVPSLVRGRFAALVATSVGLAAVSKKMFLEISPTSVGAVTITATQLILKTLAAVSTGASSLATTFLSSVTMNVTAIGVVVFTSSVIFVKNLVATAIGTVNLIKKVMLTLTVVAVAALGTTRKMFVTMATTAIGAVNLNVKQLISRTLSAIATGAVSLLTTLTVSITLSTVSTAIAGIRKGMFVGLSATAIATANFVKGMFQTLSATSVGAVTITATQLILKTLAAVSTGVSSLVETFLSSVTMNVIATGTAVLTSLATFVQGLVVTALGAVSLNVIKTLGASVKRRVVTRIGIMKRGISRFFK